MKEVPYYEQEVEAIHVFDELKYNDTHFVHELALAPTVQKLDTQLEWQSLHILEESGTNNYNSKIIVIFVNLKKYKIN